MDRSPKVPHSHLPDRLSDLPDALLLLIISFLPTRVAARTSVLSSRFRYLWEASPSLDLEIYKMLEPRKSNLFAVVDRLLFHRNPANALLLSLNVEITLLISEHYASCLLAKVCTFKLEHLTIRYMGDPLPRFLPNIFSMKSLESLSLYGMSFNKDYVLPSTTGLTRLRTLSIDVKTGVNRHAQISRLISELCFLEDLTIKWRFKAKNLTICSKTIKKLKLLLSTKNTELVNVMMSLPSLELFHFKNVHTPQKMLRFQGQIPLLQKAVLEFSDIRNDDCSGAAELMKYVAHTQKLYLWVQEHTDMQFPPNLFKTWTEVPQFPNLKRLSATMCFNEYNMKGVVSMLQHSPSLESVILSHEVCKFNGSGVERDQKDWTSKLPRDEYTENDRCTVFVNLHLGENRKNFFNALSEKSFYKRQA